MLVLLKQALISTPGEGVACANTHVGVGRDLTLKLVLQHAYTRSTLVIDQREGDKHLLLYDHGWHNPKQGKTALGLPTVAEACLDLSARREQLQTAPTSWAMNMS